MFFEWNPGWPCGLRLLAQCLQEMWVELVQNGKQVGEAPFPCGVLVECSAGGGVRGGLWATVSFAMVAGECNVLMNPGHAESGRVWECGVLL